LAEEKERRLYEEGEALSREAMKYNIASSELRNLFETSQRKTIAFLEAYVKMQTKRKLDGFGHRVLEMIRRHENNRSEIESVLRYMNMTYGYVRQMGYLGKSEVGGTGVTRLSPETESKIAGLIRPRVEKLGFQKVVSSKQGNSVQVDVHLQVFPSERPGIFARDLSQLLSNLPEFSGCMVRVRFVTERR